MAKLRLTLSDVSGITPEELRKYSKQDLLRVLAPIRDAANKRIGRLEKSGLNNIPALNAIRDTGGRIYGSQWTTNKELIKEIQRGQAFLGYKTSKVSSAREFEKFQRLDLSKAEQRARAKNQMPIPNFRFGRGVSYNDLSNTEVGLYWDIIHKMQESGVQISGEYYDAFKTLLRNSVSSDDPVETFINSQPAKAQEYIRKRVYAVSGDDENSTIVERILTGINAYNDWVVDEGGKAGNEGEDGDYVFL